MFASYVCRIETSDVGHQETRGIKAPNVDFASDLISAASKVQSRDITHFIRHSGFLAVGLCVNFPRHFNIEDN